MTTRRWVSASVLLMLASVTSAAGQTSSGERHACWTSRRTPDCRSHWIAEVRGVVPLASTGDVDFVEADGRTATSSAFEPGLEWELGHLVPATSRWSAGGSIVLGTGGHPDPIRGARIRVRRWRGGRPGFEIEAGFVRSDGAGSREEGASGLLVGVRALPWDELGVSARAEYLGAGRETGETGSFGLLLGVSASGVPGLIATGAIGVVAAVVSVVVGLNAT